MFNLDQFLVDATRSMAALLPIVMAIVQWLGKMGLEGRAQFISSLVTGFLLGTGVMYFQIHPTNATGMFSVAFFGLLTGLSASGVYDVLVKSSSMGAKDQKDNR